MPKNHLEIQLFCRYRVSVFPESAFQTSSQVAMILPVCSSPLSSKDVGTPAETHNHLTAYMTLQRTELPCHRGQSLMWYALEWTLLRHPTFLFYSIKNLSLSQSTQWVKNWCRRGSQKQISTSCMTTPCLDVIAVVNWTCAPQGA